MFYNATNFKQDLSKWTFPNAADDSNAYCYAFAVFSGCPKLGPDNEVDSSNRNLRTCNATFTKQPCNPGCYLGRSGPFDECPEDERIPDTTCDGRVKDNCFEQNTCWWNGKCVEGVEPQR